MNETAPKTSSSRSRMGSVCALRSSRSRRLAAIWSSCTSDWRYTDSERPLSCCLDAGPAIDVCAGPDLGGRALRRLHELKTGRLLAAAVGTVLTLTGESGPTERALRRFAAELGILFQIVDDILDVTADEVLLGRPHGSDARHGKRTFAGAFGVYEARRLAGESHAIARAALAEVPGDTTALHHITDYILARRR